jgi:Zn-dependent M32 family carboxypeptidase
MTDTPIPNSAYARLADRFARIATIGEASSILNWDAAAMMPAGGASARGDQLAVLAGISHGMLTISPPRSRSGRATTSGGRPTCN